MIGKYTSKVLPLPISLMTVISPLHPTTIPLITDDPKPVPSPTPLVVKYGSNIFSRTSGLIPHPVSLTRIANNRPVICLDEIQ